MILDNTNKWNSPRRSIAAKVELYNGSALASTYLPTDALKGFTIERVGEGGKFFGFGVSQSLKLELVDKEREISIGAANSLKAFLASGGDYLNTYPEFYVEEAKRDENTNDLTITAHDAIFKAAAHTVEELALAAPYTIQNVAEACALKLGLTLRIDAPEGFDLEFENGANFEGTETLRQALNAVAEATQTIYFINYNNELVFKRLDNSAAPALTIDKSCYTTLDSKAAHTITSVVSATALGENISAGSDEGETQYVRDNPFWDINENVATLVEGAAARISGLTITPFSCSWRGNAALEPGDKVALVAKDNSAFTSFVLNDSIKYNGGLSASTSWEYAASEETHSNPSTLGEALKQTYAKVDKVNKEVEIVAGETATIKADANAISASVKNIDENVAGLSSEVNAKMSAEEVNISIQKAMQSGTEKVVTTTGYKLDENGLHISKSGKEITTNITEDGMTVYRNDNEVLVANNEGVKAEDLHATTYLIIGNTSRFEDYGYGRTGCFWVAKMR